MEVGKAEEQEADNKGVRIFVQCGFMLVKSEKASPFHKLIKGQQS